MANPDPVSRLRDAARNRVAATAATKAAAAAVNAEREAQLAADRATPKTTAEPLPEAPAGDEGEAG